MMLRYRSTLLLAALSSLSTTVKCDLLSNQIAFSDDLVALLYDAESTTNDCTSALGVSMAFSLVYPSMVDPTLTETADIFGFPPVNDTSSSNLVWSATEADLEAAHDGSCVFPEDSPPCNPVHPTLLISNSVWLDADRPVNTNYTDLLPEDVVYNDLSFADPAAGDTVNAWVNQSTNGLIDSIVDAGPLSGISIVAINAIYLKAEWVKPFQTMYTSQDLFYTSADRTTVRSEEVAFLHNVDNVPYGETSTHQVVSLPLASKEDSPLTMTFALPFVVGTSLATSEEILGLEMNTRGGVAIALPKFEFESTYTSALKSALASLGLVTPFQTGLCVYENDDCTTAVDTIIQKTVIAVDEQGVEAAAVTALVGRNFPIFPDGSIEFLADHPFQFFIHAGVVVLFEGQVVFPESPSSSDAPLVEGGHATGEIWSNMFRVSVVKPTIPMIATGGNSTMMEEETMAPAAAVTNAPVVAPVNIFAPPNNMTEPRIDEVPVIENVTEAPPLIPNVTITLTQPPVVEVIVTESPTSEPAAMTDADLDAGARNADVSSSPAVRVWLGVSATAMLILERFVH